MSFYLTNEYAAVCAAMGAARALEQLAHCLQDLDSPEAKLQAKHAKKEAKQIKQLRRELIRCHKQKQPGGKQ